MENCQLGVFLAYATPSGRALLDAELYLPKSWSGDRARCAQAGIPDSVPFATKPALAAAMLERALDGGVPASWVSADEAHGQDHKFRLFLEKRKVGYVVAVPKSQSLGSSIGYGNTGSRADAVTADAPAQAWKRLSAGDGAKGPRVYDWAMATLPPHAGDELGQPGGFQRWLLARRSLTPNDQGELELARRHPRGLPQACLRAHLLAAPLFIALGALSEIRRPGERDTGPATPRTIPGQGTGL